ncbi:MAG: polysaccharide deacetylase family protein, partial [Nitrospira sp.]|nr:polysaccharide deacetylase family protein [Nitrospira sp.]
MYHRVLTSGEASRQSVQPGMYVLDTVFAQQMTFVKENFTVLSFQELLTLWQSGKWNDQARYCVVTFDDGWLDNYRHAYPILKRLGLPATIFLPTDYVGSDEWFWPDQLSFLLKVVADRQVMVEDINTIEGVLSRFLNGDIRLPLETLACCEQVTDHIIHRCKPLPIQRIRELIETLAFGLKVSLPNDRVIVNWDEVREMSRHALSFGSHSCSH